MTLKVTVLMVELKIKVSGFTVMVVPAGDMIEALYVELTAPTFVTFLVREVEFWRLGMVMEGRFKSRIECSPVGQRMDCSVN